MYNIVVHISPHPAGAQNDDIVSDEPKDKDVTPSTGSGFVKPSMPVTNAGYNFGRIQEGQMLGFPTLIKNIKLGRAIRIDQLAPCGAFRLPMDNISCLGHTSRSGSRYPDFSMRGIGILTCLKKMRVFPIGCMSTKSINLFNTHPSGCWLILWATQMTTNGTENQISGISISVCCVVHIWTQTD